MDDVPEYIGDEKTFYPFLYRQGIPVRLLPEIRFYRKEIPGNDKKDRDGRRREGPGEESFKQQRQIGLPCLRIGGMGMDQHHTGCGEEGHRCQLAA